MCLNSKLDNILSYYYSSFKEKVQPEYSEEYDILMRIFNISPKRKHENMQYWGRELGMCWQKIVVELAKHCCGTRYRPPLRKNNDELNDLFIDNDAIDTKYRIGSGDSGTLRKFKYYGNTLIKEGYKPIMLILRTDNLGAAINAVNYAGWRILIGNNAFRYILRKTGYNLKSYLVSKINLYNIN